MTAKHVELFARVEDENGDEHFVPLDCLVNDAIRSAILGEREACANIVEEFGDSKIAKAIRKRATQ